MNPRHQKILKLLENQPLSTLQISRQLNLLAQLLLHADLWEMEHQGLITGYYDEQRLEVRQGNRRRFYCLTRLGKQALED